MNQLKTVSDYHTTLKQTRLGALNLFSSHEWMEHNIKIGQSFITLFFMSFVISSLLSENSQNSKRMLSTVCKLTTAYSSPV